MPRELIVDFGPEGPFTVLAGADGPGQTPDEARRWLDQQFVALDCEPLRASGKVLTADKLLAVAEAAGRATFERDADWARAFAAAALAAMGRPVVHIDLVGQQVKA